MQWNVGDRRSFEHRFTTEQVSSFAKLVGDFNPLHVDPEYSRNVIGGEPVVHGMLAASFVSTLIGMQLPGPGALWQSFQVTWRKMIRADDLIRFDAKVKAVHSSTNTIDISIQGTKVQSGEICLEGEGRVMIVQKEPITVVAPELAGQTILITGATGQLGQAICKELTGRGAKLVVCGRNEARLSALSAKLGNSVVSQHIFDLKETALLKDVLDQTLSNHNIFGFIHVAAPAPEYYAVGEPEMGQQLREQWEVNVWSFYCIVQQIIKTMPQGGAIVHVLTQFNFDAPPPKLAAYVSAKMAAWGLIKSMAVEYGPKGIRCNAVSPSMMNTEFTQDIPLRVKQVEAANNPLRRLCMVEDVAKAAAFLCSPDSAFINGVNLPVTGGARMP